MLQSTEMADPSACPSAGNPWGERGAITAQSADAFASISVSQATLPHSDANQAAPGAGRTAPASEAERGWQGFLRDLGVSAAIFSISGGSGSRRQAYIVGFDDARDHPQLTRALMQFGDRVWHDAAESAAWSFRVADRLAALGQAATTGDPASGSGGFILAGQGGAEPSLDRTLQPFDHAAALRVAEDGATLCAVLLRKAADGPFTSACFRSLANVLPLVLQSAAARAAAKGQQQRVSQLEAVLDRVSLATLLVDMECRPIFCNEAARTLLQQQDWILRAADGTINCAKQGESKKLRDAVRAVAVQGEHGAPDTVIRLDGPDGSWRLAFVVPATPNTPDGACRSAMIVIHAPTTVQASPHLLEALGLLPSERRFLTSFLKASSLNEAAVDSGLSAETARTYLKRVRAKLGVHRQMDLASLISGLVPPLKQNRPHPTKAAATKTNAVK